MAEKFNNKYRIESARLPNWDYGSNSAYFITVCTHNKVHFFGEILYGEMQLSEIGKMAEKYWYDIPRHFSFVKLDAFVVMPNHIHGILIIDKIDLYDGRDAINRVSTHNTNNTEKTITGGITGNKNPMSHENISRIIRWYKGRCTFEIRKIRVDFYWQSRFHDHIIKNDDSYQRIKNYIINNPINWDNDKFYNPNSDN